MTASEQTLGIVSGIGFVALWVFVVTAALHVVRAVLRHKARKADSGTWIAFIEADEQRLRDEELRRYADLASTQRSRWEQEIAPDRSIRYPFLSLSAAENDYAFAGAVDFGYEHPRTVITVFDGDKGSVSVEPYDCFPLPLTAGIAVEPEDGSNVVDVMKLLERSCFQSYGWGPRSAVARHVAIAPLHHTPDAWQFWRDYFMTEPGFWACQEIPIDLWASWTRDEPRNPFAPGVRVFCPPAEHRRGPKAFLYVEGPDAGFGQFVCIKGSGVALATYADTPEAWRFWLRMRTRILPDYDQPAPSWDHGKVPLDLWVGSPLPPAVSPFAPGTRVYCPEPVPGMRFDAGRFYYILGEDA